MINSVAFWEGVKLSPARDNQETRPNDLATSDAAVGGDGNAPLGFPSSLSEQSSEVASYPSRSGDNFTPLKNPHQKPAPKTRTKTPNHPSTQAPSTHRLSPLQPHRISITEETVFSRNCMRIRPPNGFHPRKCRHQHQQRALGQMKVRD